MVELSGGGVDDHLRWGSKADGTAGIFSQGVAIVVASVEP